MRYKKNKRRIKCSRCGFDMVVRKKVNYPFGKNSKKRITYFLFCKHCKLKIKNGKKLKD